MGNFAKYKEKGLLFDSLEHEYDVILRPDLQIVIRLDGMSFTSKFLKSFSKSTYSIYQECMINVVHELCSLFKSTKIAYTHTDEINLILSGKDVESNDFNRVQKILEIQHLRCYCRYCLTHNIKSRLCAIWSGRGESDPHLMLGKHV